MGVEQCCAQEDDNQPKIQRFDPNLVPVRKMFSRDRGTIAQLDQIDKHRKGRFEEVKEGDWSSSEGDE